MSGQRLVRGLVPRLGAAAVLALATASCWWVWMAWDHDYRIDPVTGEAVGPYEAWQVIGCGVCLVAVCVVATLRLPVWIVVLVMPIAFMWAWAATAASTDSTGLWLVGAFMMLAGGVPLVALVSSLTHLVRPRERTGRV
ncbi:hypothetical protein [Pseudonocardia phyllosphaerae]|uniref:hypothetical protein n=1 Tax=Pseudonocardia phyllosphaerae TaxID=3390502 RepID=UPI00397D2B1F